MSTDTWFTGDTHFGHRNIIEYCNRPFKNENEMDAILIERWNEYIKPHDTVFHVGDFTLHKIDFAAKIFEQLNGDISVVPGNHDHRWFGRLGGLHSKHNPVRELPPIWDKHKIVLCHYGMRVWNRAHHGAMHLYGHSHANLPAMGRSMDVGVDTNNYYPYNIDEITNILMKISPHNSKG